MTKATWGRKGSFHLTAHNRGKAGQELKAGPEAEAMEEGCFLACFFWLAQIYFPVYPRLISSGMALPTVVSALALLYQLAVKKIPQRDTHRLI